jgi:conjugative transfer signal peptidase TraF
MSDNRKRIVFSVALLAASSLCAVIVSANHGYRLNTTDSVPVGIYQQINDPRADYIAFCPTQEQIRIANERKYRYRSVGCADGFAPLIKPVRARSGDTVTVSAQGLSVNGTMLLNSTAKRIDGQGRPLPFIPYGVYSVAPNTVWVVSSYNPASFDSRYFGPVSLTRIISYAKPIWTF